MNWLQGALYPCSNRLQAMHAAGQPSTGPMRGTARALPSSMRSLVALAALVIVLAAVKLASSIVVPLLLALTLAIAFRPVGVALARRGFRPAVTALVTIS